MKVKQGSHDFLNKVLVLVCVLLSSGCTFLGLGDGQQAPASPRKEESVPLKNVWFTRQIKVQVLEYQLVEIGSPEWRKRLTYTTDERRRYLEKAGILIVDEERVDVETDQGKWGDMQQLAEGEGVPYSTFLSSIDQGLADIVDHGTVEICGNEITGKEVVDGYMEGRRGLFDEKNEYVTDIDAFISCDRPEDVLEEIY